MPSNQCLRQFQSVQGWTSYSGLKSIDAARLATECDSLVKREINGNQDFGVRVSRLREFHPQSHAEPNVNISALSNGPRMSDLRHADVRSESLIGAGYLPDLIPA